MQYSHFKVMQLVWQTTLLLITAVTTIRTTVNIFFALAVDFHTKVHRI